MTTNTDHLDRIQRLADSGHEEMAMRYAKQLADHEYVDELDTDEQRVLALMLHLDDGTMPDDITDEGDGRLTTGHGHHRHEYLVLTDDEADELWDEQLESYIDDCMEIPKEMENYFDREAWKRDARMDGRGHSLSSYDGDEYEVDAGETFFIYRTQ